MKLNHNKVLKAYNEACDALAAEFVATYYPCEPEGEEADCDWVADEPGGVLNVGDEYWDMSTMVQALDLNADEDKLFNWYWGSVEAPRENGFPSLKNYLKL